MTSVELSAAQRNSSLLSDEKLAPFLDPAFDPVDYLNASLPQWSPSSAVTTKQDNASSLADISAETQTLLSRLNAQITRLSATLTQLTDDILRSGGRLSYEVELLRGDVSSLSDTLTNGLRDDIEHFFPGGLDARARKRRTSTHHSGQDVQAMSPLSPSVSHNPTQALSGEAVAVVEAGPRPSTPDYVKRLQMLMAVRARLDKVVKVFGEAMEWVVSPSEVSLKSSLLAVTAPESNRENEQQELKGKEYAEKVRTELAELLSEGTDDGSGEAFKAAIDKVERMRELAEVWKGTAEEKARIKFVESLTKMIEDKRGTP